jgi:hypothetical protein
MSQRPSSKVVLLLITLLLFQQFSPLLTAQTAVPTAAELDQLLAPVALYPDSLLSQITTASTNPQEILDVDNWLADNSGLTGTALTDAAQQHGFDPAFIALVNFPQVLEMMAEHIDDYSAIGAAFTADQGAVSASIQRLRDQAYNAGTLRSSEQQQVEVQQSGGQPIYVIQPTTPQVVYVPEYDPTVVYVGGGPSLISFGIGIGIGALLVDNQPWGWGGWGWNWGARRAYYNHGYWGGWSNPYRPPSPWYRPRPIIWANRPGYRGNWRYRPNGYRPPRPGNRPGWNHRPYGPGNRPGGNRPGRPSIQPVKPGRPNRPAPNRPGTKPTPKPTPRPKPTPKPTPGRPGNPGHERPTPSKPGKPGTPSPRPTPDKPRPTPGSGTRPQPSKPAPDRPSTRPTPAPKPRPEAKPQPSKPAPSRPANPRPTPQARPATRPAPQKPAPKPAPKPADKPQPK